MNKKTIYIALLGILVFLVGFFLGNRTRQVNNLGSVSKGKDSTFQAGWEAARKKVADSGLVAPLANIEIKNISGQVTGIKDSQITVKTISPDPLADPGAETKIVGITGNTKIYQLIAKNPEQFQKEMREFADKLKDKASQENLSPPSSSEKREASLGDIKVGQVVSVMADKDIKNLKQFEALEVDIQVSP